MKRIIPKNHIKTTLKRHFLNKLLLKTDVNTRRSVDTKTNRLNMLNSIIALDTRQ